MQKYLITTILGVGLFFGSSQAATISGTVTDSVAQTPIGNVIVQVRSGNQVLAVDTTDAQGAYSVTAADSGRVTVRASLSSTYNSKNIDTVLSATPYTLNFPLVKIITTTISGVVSDSAAGTPLSGVIVRLLGTGSGPSLAKDTTGADGAYSFANVTTETQTVQASLSGYVTKSMACTVSSATPITINIPLVQTVYSKVSGIVKDSVAGTPIAGVVVRLGISGGGGSSRKDTTGEDGAYSFDSVASGTQSLQVSNTAQYATKTVSVTISSSAPVTADILLSAATYTKVSGIVSDSTTGTALAGAVVSLGSGLTAVRDTTGTDGTFSFDSVRSGNQSISVAVSRYKSKTVQLTISGTDPVNAPIALVPIVYGSVSGVVTDSAKGTPLAGAIVILGSGMGGTIIMDTTGADGAYSFPEAPEGSQTIQVSLAKYTGKSTQVTVAGGTPATANFALVAIIYSSVSGVVTDSATGTPLAGVEVRIGSMGAYLYDTTGTDGAYQFAEVAIGSEPMKITAAGRDFRRDTLTIVSSAPVTHNIVLGGKSAVIGHTISKMSSEPQLLISGNSLIVSNILDNSKLSLFSLDGKCVYKTMLGKHTSMILPNNIRTNGSAMIVQIETQGKTYTQRILSVK